MKNKLTDLNDHLFAQMERLSDESLSTDDIEKECKRADAIVAISDQIMQGANTQLKAAKLIADHGDRFGKMLPSIGGTQEATALPSAAGTSGTSATTQPN